MPQSHTGGGVVQQSRGGADARRIAADGAVDAESKRALAGGGVVGGGGCAAAERINAWMAACTTLISERDGDAGKAKGAVMELADWQWWWCCCYSLVLSGWLVGCGSSCTVTCLLLALAR